jgi:hypothetical protein
MIGSSIFLDIKIGIDGMGTHHIHTSPPPPKVQDLEICWEVLISCPWEVKCDMSLGQVPELLWQLHGEIGFSVITCCFGHLCQSKIYEHDIPSNITNTFHTTPSAYKVKSE